MYYYFLRWLKIILFYAGIVLVGYGETRLLVSEEFIHDLEKVKAELVTAFQYMFSGFVFVLVSLFFKKR